MGIEAEVEEAKQRCKRAITKISTATTVINETNQRTLLKLATSELNSLSRFNPLSSNHLSVNIGHLEAVLHLLHHPLITNVSRVCKPLPITQTLVAHVDIVCTLDKRPVWVLVSDRNPHSLSWLGSLHDGSSTSNGDKRGDKGFRFRVHRLLEVAKCAHVVTRPSSIVLFFSRGVADSVFQNLTSEFGAKDLGLEFDCHGIELVEGGDWVNVVNSRSFTDARAFIIDVIGHMMGEEEEEEKGVLGSLRVVVEPVLDPHGRLGGLHDSGPKKVMNMNDFLFHGLVSRLKLTTPREAKEKHLIGDGDGDDAINFDTTALIALVSGISNGCTGKLLATPEIELKQRFKGNYEFVIAQACF